MKKAIIEDSTLQAIKNKSEQDRINFACKLFNPILNIIQTQPHMQALAERYMQAISKINKEIQKSKHTSPIKQLKVKQISSEKLQADAKAKAFVMAFINSNFRTKDAAIAIGYADKTASNMGAKLLANPIVQEYLHEILSSTKSSAIATLDELLSTATQIVRNDEEKSENRLKAIDTIAKVSGLNTDEERAKNAGVIVNIQQTAVPQIHFIK